MEGNQYEVGDELYRIYTIDNRTVSAIMLEKLVVETVGESVSEIKNITADKIERQGLKHSKYFALTMSELKEKLIEIMPDKQAEVEKLTSTEDIEKYINNVNALQKMVKTNINVK
jgi:hypothetical protein